MSIKIEKQDLEKQQQQEAMNNNTRNCSERCSFTYLYQRSREGLIEQYQFARKYPFTVLSACLLCALLMTCGVALSLHFRHAELEALEQEAITVADETALFFSNQLDQAILPLFSLAQFVNEIPIFSDLESQIGYNGEPNALPQLSGTHRNVTGVCDQPELVQRFNKIASTLKENAHMNGILVTLQLLPSAVGCVSYPLNNTEDFPEGVFLDNTGAIGHDLLLDPQRVFIAEQTLGGDDLVVAGPLTLRQCKECDPTVKKAFIARLPINSLQNNTTADLTTATTGRKYGKWGFAVALINWEQLVVKSGMYEAFEEGDLEFQLTRTDRTYNETDSTIDENVVVLAESPDFEGTDPNYRVNTALETTNNEWEMTIAYCTCSACLDWFPWAITATVLVSLFISGLVYTIFMQKQRHSDAIEEKSRQMIEAAKRSARNERELNDFIAHEVRNPISAALSACSFVSASVNETEPLVDVESRTTVVEDVKIIESSLKYANDLLHSMLDLNRGNTEITIRTLPTCIKRDILEPVASMILVDRRDEEESFEVIVECNPASLIVSVDRLRLKQIVLNLARNSARYVGAGGFVRLRASALIHDNSRLLNGGATTQAGGILISVEDSGPGVPPEKRTQLFTKYQKSLEELNQGAGIGLSLCKKLLAFMEGGISLDEEYNSGVAGMPGAKFDVELPCDFIQVRAEDSGETMDPTSGSDSTASTSASLAPLAGPVEELPEKMTVLFVDDDTVLRKLFARSLKRIRPGWAIREAPSGEAALELTNTEGGAFFDMIFLDQHMSSTLLGTETARLLREQGVTSIICGLSANDMQEEFERCGADHFINKPFPCEPKALREAMLNLVSHRKGCVSRNPSLSSLDQKTSPRRGRSSSII
ncbi:MAG: hypothetical protein SGILL_006662 [Bacillariaceae sp.]